LFVLSKKSLSKRTRWNSKISSVRKLFVLVFSFCVGLLALPACSGGSADNPPETTDDVYTIHGKKYVLTFYDDFDGDELDETKWEHCPEWERQDLKIPWRDEAAYLDGKGNLVISVLEDEKTGYKTGAVRTNGRFSQTYGYFEIRAKLQQSEGFWTAFWLMGPSQGNIGNGSADGAEIDIFEALYKDRPRIHHAIHWDGYGKDHKSIANSYPAPDDIYDGYHTFALEWSKDAYTFYVDDVETWRTTADGICNQPLYMKVTAEVGTWGGSMKNAKLPDQMLVDYVKAYQFVEE
jgi:beta-glucanase (GH16 family)